MSENLPVLYSFRRCPYAMRARFAIKISNIQVELREVKLADKPKLMLDCSPKGTVPVLQLPDGSVIDESLDIMIWALSQNDPQNWLIDNLAEKQEISRLININDNEFKQHLDHYKYADRFPQHSKEYYREQAEVFLKLLEEKLNQSDFIICNNITLVDIAIFPFVRQFAYVDKDWFDQSGYTNLKDWLSYLLKWPLFNQIMDKYEPWASESNIQLF